MVINLLDSKSFAVVGASNDSDKVGYIIFKNLIERRIKAYPINSKHSKVLKRKTYAALIDLDKKVDCVIIAVPAKFVPEILQQAGRKKIKNAVVISAGFSETGNDNLEKQIKLIAKKEGISLLGPNTFGFVNPYNNVNTTFFEGMPEKGSVAFISQSGAIGSAILDKEKAFSGFVAVGISALMDFSDFIEYYNHDKNTKVICIYMESLKPGKGKKFMKACRNSKKPVVVLKAGKSRAGQKAAASHTASLASEAGIYEGIFKQCGVIEVDSISEMFETAKLLSKIDVKHKKVCVVTNAGGLGVLSSDYCEKNNIEIAKLDDNILKELNKILPESWSHNNPIDIIGDATPELYYKTLKALEKKEFFDFFIVLLTPQFMSNPEETARKISKIKKPVLACFMGKKSVEKANRILRENKISAFDDPEDLCRALGKI